MSKLTVSRCQVCGKQIPKGFRNCGLHLHVREKTAPLAQEVDTLERSITTDKVKELAIKYGHCEQTVRNHLKRSGYRVLRGWEKGEKDE